MLTTIETEAIFIIILLVFCCFILLALRELVSAFRFQYAHPERGAAFFNAGILCILAGGVLLGGVVLWQHRQTLTKLVQQFPTARYAPEREPFTPGKSWIFVTNASRRDVLAFYERTLPPLGYTLVFDAATSTDFARVLFRKGSTRIFLTIEEKQNMRILHYSEEGTIIIVPLSR